MSDRDQTGRKAGYCSPPEATQFKKGNCANPHGRKGKPKPSEAFDVAAIVADFLAEKVTVTRRGKREKVSAFRAILSVLLSKTLQGDMAASRQLLSLCLKTDVDGRAVKAAKSMESEHFQMVDEFLRAVMGETGVAPNM